MLLKNVVIVSLNTKPFSTQLNFVNRFCKFKVVTTEKVRQLHSQSITTEILHNNSLNNTVLPVPVKVLECLLETDQKKISRENIIDTTHSLFSLLSEQKKIFENKKNKELIQKILFTLLNVHKDKLQVTEAVEILKCFKTSRLPYSSEVVKSLVEIIYNSLHDLELKDYNLIYRFVSVILLPDKEIHLIQSTLKNSFEKKMSQGFDVNNLDVLTEIFTYASSNLEDENIFQNIINSLKSFETIPIRNAISLMICFCNVTPFLEEWNEMFQQIQNILINNIDQIRTKDIKYILKTMAFQENKDRLTVQRYNNPLLLDHFIEKIVLEDIGFKKASMCLINFVQLRYVSKKLVSYISAKHFEEYHSNSTFSLSYLKDLLELVNALALLKYKPIFWEEIYKTLKNSNLLSKMPNKILVRYSLNLSCLDCYDIEILEHIFSTAYNEKEKGSIWNLLYLWHHLKMNLNYNGPLPSQEILDSFNLVTKTAKYPLLPHLNELVGSNKYIKTNLRTKLYHHVDHALVFQGKDDPIAINDNNNETESVQYLEDIEVSDNTKIVAILYLHKFWYLLNTNEIIGMYGAYVESLKTLTRHLLIISEEDWKQTPEDSRTEFLRNKINSKLYSNSY